MRQTFPTQDGGAIVQPAATAQSAARDSLSCLSYMDMRRALTESERMRGELLAGFVRRFFAWLSSGVKRATQSAYDRYLAQATDLADLERRQLELERGEKSSFC